MAAANYEIDLFCVEADMTWHHQKVAAFLDNAAAE